jgi:hypothetical protein
MRRFVLRVLGIPLVCFLTPAACRPQHLDRGKSVNSAFRIEQLKLRVVLQGRGVVRVPEDSSPHLRCHTVSRQHRRQRRTERVQVRVLAELVLMLDPGPFEVAASRQVGHLLREDPVAVAHD